MTYQLQYLIEELPDGNINVYEDGRIRYTNITRKGFVQILEDIIMA